MAARQKPKLNQAEWAQLTEDEAMAFGSDHARKKEPMYDLEDFPSASLYYAYEAGYTGKHAAPTAGGSGIPAEVVKAMKDSAEACAAAAASIAAIAKKIGA